MIRTIMHVNAKKDFLETELGVSVRNYSSPRCFPFSFAVLITCDSKPRHTPKPNTRFVFNMLLDDG